MAIEELLVFPEGTRREVVLIIEDVEQAHFAVRLPMLRERGQERLLVVVSRNLSRCLDAKNIVPEDL